MATLDETESQTMSSPEEIAKNPKKTCQKLLKLLADEIEASPAKINEKPGLYLRAPFTTG